MPCRVGGLGNRKAMDSMAGLRLFGYLGSAIDLWIAEVVVLPPLPQGEGQGEGSNKDPRDTHTYLPMTRRRLKMHHQTVTRQT